MSKPKRPLKNCEDSLLLRMKDTLDSLADFQREVNREVTLRSAQLPVVWQPKKQVAFELPEGAINE